MEQNELVEKGLEAFKNRRYSEATSYLAKCYKDDIWVEESIDKAVFCYKKACEQNHPLALLELGYLFLKGNGEYRDQRGNTWVSGEGNSVYLKEGD